MHLFVWEFHLINLVNAYYNKVATGLDKEGTSKCLATD